MPRPTTVLAAIAVAYTVAALSGCASAPKFADSSGAGKPRAAASGESATSRLKSMLTGKKSARQGSAFDKSYNDLRSEFTSTGVVSPRIGYGGPKPEPTGLKKWTSAVAGSSMVTSVKTAFASKEKAAPARGRSKPSFDFFGNKDEPGANGGSVSMFTESTVGPDIYVVMARRHELSGQVAEAATDYRSALDIEEHHLLATTGLARLLDRQGKQREAYELFVAATKHHPKAATAWNDLGTFHAQHQHSRDAIRAMERAVSIDPQRDLYRNNLAMFLVEAGQPKQALAHLQAIHPPAVAHYSLGYLLKEQGHSDEALAYFRTAYHQDPQLEEARLAIEMFARQNSPAFEQHLARAPVAHQSTPPLTLDDARPEYTRRDNTRPVNIRRPENTMPHVNTVLPVNTVPEDVMLDAHRASAPAGRVAHPGSATWQDGDQSAGGHLGAVFDPTAGGAIAGDTYAEDIAQPRVEQPGVEQPGQAPLASAPQRDAYQGQTTPADTADDLRFTMLSEDNVANETGRYNNVADGSTYTAHSAEVQSLARQLAPANDATAVRHTDTGTAVADADADDPLSRALRQAVEEGDNSLRRSWN